MEELNLVWIQKKHNQSVLLAGIGWTVLALGSWFVSVCGAWALAKYPPSLIRPPSETVIWIGVGIIMLLLALECFRFYGVVFGKRRFIRSIYFHALDGAVSQSDQARYLEESYKKPLLILEILFVAPRSVVRAIYAFKSCVYIDKGLFPRVRAVIDTLEEKKTWVIVTKFAKEGFVLWPLCKLGIIYETIENDVAKIRLHPDFFGYITEIEAEEAHLPPGEFPTHEPPKEEEKEPEPPEPTEEEEQEAGSYKVDLPPGL